MIPTDQEKQDALKVAGEWCDHFEVSDVTPGELAALLIRYAAEAVKQYRSTEILTPSERYLLQVREEAVAAARPEIERAERIKTLEDAIQVVFEHPGTSDVSIQLALEALITGPELEIKGEG